VSIPLSTINRLSGSLRLKRLEKRKERNTHLPYLTLI
jgi:hypothetical protein